MKFRILLGLLGTVIASAEVALTIYNGDLAVVRDVVPIQLVDGDAVVRYDQATAQVIPDSVVLRDPAGAAKFALREQSYRNDPVSQGLLLSLFEGEELSFENERADGTIDFIKGKVIRSGYTPSGRSQSPVIETKDGLRFSLPGEPVFPALGDNSILRPTLSWTLSAAESVNFDAQLSYLTRGLSWEASYNLVAPEEGEEVSLSGWITAKNHSGTSFQGAKLKLVAGDVNTVRGGNDSFRERARPKLRSMAMADEAVAQKSFDGFHLYTLPRPISLNNQETKQVEFVRSEKVKAFKTYVYDPVNRRFRGSRYSDPLQDHGTKEIAMYWSFKNSEKNGLGIPMPKGTVRFYREDSADGNLEFVGGNSISHTPKNEELKIYTGNAFDLVGERKVLDFKSDKRAKIMKETIELTLKNRSEKAQTIIAREHLWRWSNWTIEGDSDFEKKDADTIEFSVELRPDEVKKIRYQVTYTW